MNNRAPFLSRWILIGLVALRCPLWADGPWKSPNGIPQPQFGIVESHTMYQGQLYDYNNDGTPEAPYKDAGNGPYTHYVDRSAPNATDGVNDSNYGTPVLPRLTIPGDNSNSLAPLKAGSVVEIHGRYDHGHTSPADLHFAGTVAKPIFIRGASAANRPIITGPFEIIGSSYTIVENVIFKDRDGNRENGGDTGSFAVTDKNGVRIDSDHIALRHCDVSGNFQSGGTGIGGYSGTTIVSHIVFWDNKIYQNGNWQATFDQDVHGTGVGTGAQFIWLVDNEYYENSGDGVQINGTHALTHHIYVGRNVSHQNKQTGLWSKYASDVIFSQNTVYHHRPSDSSNGSGMGFQYDPERIWFLYNHSYDNNVGISSGSDNLGIGQNAYFVGNIIHDIIPSGTFDPDNSYNDGSGINIRGDVNRYFVNNTIYNTYGGIVCYQSGAIAHLENNIIVNMKGGGRSIFVDMPAVAAASNMKNNLLFQPGGTPTINWGSTVYTGLANFQSATGKGQGCVEADPLFVNAAANDFHLQNTSPARDTGLASSVYTTFQTLYGLSIAVDPDNQTRPQGSAWDMGAFEFTNSNPDTDGDGLPDAWEVGHWGTIDGHSALDDFDRDGLVELLEYAFGLNPKTPDRSSALAATTENGYLTITLTKRNGVTLTVQTTGNLAPAAWSSASTTVLIDNATTLKVRDDVPIATGSSRYLRVRVTAL
jgi:hypothetical protein